MKDHNRQKGSTALHVLLACAVLQKPILRSRFLSLALISLVLTALHAIPASAQQPWSTPDPTSGNIYSTNSGNVGIGTTAPSNILELNRNQNSNTDLVLTNANTGSNAQANIVATSDVANIQLKVHAAARTITRYGVTVGGFVEMVAVAGNGFLLGTHTNATPIIFGTNSLERMRIDSAGNVGIGTTNPVSKLHIVGGDLTIANNTAIKLVDDGGVSRVFGLISSQYGYQNEQLIGAAAIAGTGGGRLHLRAPGGDIYLMDGTGFVGIGIGNPSVKLHVVGDGKFTGGLTVDGTFAAKYQDVAEWVPASEQIPAGTVVVLDSTKSNHVISSAQPYDTRVAGVISEQPGIALGEGGDGKVLVATTGRVRIKVDASQGPIQVGDLLVTSDKAGMAMKSKPLSLGGVQIHRPGTLIGKALEPLEKGTGEILVLLSLQ